MRIRQRPQQIRQPTSRPLIVVIHHAYLIWVGSTVTLYCKSLPTPDQFAARFPEMLPSSQRMLARFSGGRPIPALHRMNAPAVANDKAADIERMRQRAVLSRAEDLIVTGKIQTQLAEPGAKFRDALEMTDLWKRLYSHG